MKKILIVVAALLLFAGSFLAWFVPSAWYASPSPGTVAVSFTISSGTTVDGIATLLEQKGVITSAFGYELYARIDPATNRARPGSYRIPSGTNFRAVARILALGPERDETEVKILEGWTIADEAEELAKYGVQSFAPTAGEWVVDFPFLKNLPRSTSLEGYLFPDTYRVYSDQLPEGLIKKQLATFASVTDGMEAEALKQGRTMRDVLILASIVEKEATDLADKKVVAGIYLNRLNIGMALQSDATVNYVTHAGRARPTLEDLEAVSPYNTYKNKGLPPGPICNPGRDALEAALHPTPSDYLFYLHDAQGKSYYARNLEEHKQNRIRAYGE